MYIKEIAENNRYKYMKALQVYPVKENTKKTVGFKLDEETVDELILQLLTAKKEKPKHYYIKGFRDNKNFFIQIEK